MHANESVTMKNTADSSLAHDRAVGEPERAALGLVVPDWRALAEQRLKRLVEVEYDQAQVGKRLAALQLDYRHLVATSETRLGEIQVLEHRCVVLEEQLQNALQHLERMQASFLHSRSWRVTRPLRALSLGYASIKNRLRGLHR